MANIVEIILKGVDKSSAAFKSAEKSTRSFKDSLASMAKVAGAATIAVGIAGAAMKKAFDLGREGAAIEQTAESFDFLLAQMKVAPDLLDQLSRASNKTISTFELQASTMKLLAGASGELGPALAAATPKLLEIAKAANKLNPSLGTTAFLYESIATGVKRAQPLILDNLGLVLKVGQANEAYALELGKTVEQLTAQEKTMAILNATLLAGDQMIIQVGGDTESLTDSFDQLTVAISEMADAAKKKAAPALAGIAKRITLALTSGEKLTAVLKEHAKEVLNTSASYEEFTQEMERAVGVSDDLAESSEGVRRIRLLLLGISQAETEAFLVWADALAHSTRETEDNTGATFELLNVLEKRREQTVELISLEDSLAENTRLSAEAADEAAKASKSFLDAIDRDIDSPIESFIKDMEFIIVTEGRFKSAFKRIEISAEEFPKEALDIATKLFAMVIDTKVEMGRLTVKEGIDRLVELGFTAEEARDKIGGTDSIASAMMGLDDINLELDSLRHASQLTAFWLADLQSISGTVWEIRVNVSGAGGRTIADVLSERGAGGGTTAPASEPVGGGVQQTISGGGGVVQNFNISDRFDLEEVVGEIATRVQEV